MNSRILWVFLGEEKGSKKLETWLHGWEVTGGKGEEGGGQGRCMVVRSVFVWQLNTKVAFHHSSIYGHEFGYSFSLVEG